MLKTNLPILSPESSLREGLEVLDTKGLEIGLVCQGENLVGIFTDGDVRRALLRGAKLGGSVMEVVQTTFTSVEPTLSRAEVLDLMKARRFKQIPVVDERGHFLGLHTLDELLGTHPKGNPVLIFCGGLGTRLRPLTETIPKPMLKIAGRPILERLLLHLVGQGFRQFYFATHYLPEIIESHFGDGTQFGCRIDYLQEEKPLGTGGALRLLPPQTLPILAMNGDLVTQFNPNRMLEYHHETGNHLTIGTTNHIHDVPFGVLALDEDQVLGIQEKPRLVFNVSAGIYILSPDIPRLIEPGASIPITWVIQKCLESKTRVGRFIIDDEWADIGRHEELNRARGQV